SFHSLIDQAPPSASNAEPGAPMCRQAGLPIRAVRPASRGRPIERSIVLTRRLSDNLEAAMTPDRWIQVKQAFEAVLQLPDAEREGHLERMRSSTPEIHREVISLLAAHARAGSFLESGARISTPDEPSSPSRSREDPALPAGTRLGAYEVVALLG